MKMFIENPIDCRKLFANQFNRNPLHQIRDFEYQGVLVNSIKSRLLGDVSDPASTASLSEAKAGKFAGMVKRDPNGAPRVSRTERTSNARRTGRVPQRTQIHGGRRGFNSGTRKRFGRRLTIDKQIQRNRWPS